ncbi:MAG TPA: SMR family transporter [Candidatus Tectomicrobia bacterium]
MTLFVFIVVLLSATLHAGWNFAAKRVAGNVGALWLGLCLAAVLSWPWALLVHQSERLTLAGLPYIVATGMLHAGYFGCLARSYAVGEISLAYPVARGTGVAGTAVVAAAWLHETLSLLGLVGITAICVGTGLVGFQKRHHQDEVTGYLYALLVGTTITGYSIIDKLAVGQVHPVLYISGLFSLAALLLAPYVLGRQRAACRYAYQHLKTAICLIGMGSICTYLLILFAFRVGPVSYIVAVREFAVVIGALLGFLVLKERCTLRKVVGIAAITIGLVLVKMA